MEIDKILFGQLTQTKDIDKSFEDLDVNNDGVINEKDAAATVANKALSAQITNLLNEVDAETDLVDDADFDETELSVSDNPTTPTVANNASSAQVLAALAQLERNKLNNEQEQIQKDIENKQKELETKQNKIEAKQEELETLVKEAQNNKDNSKTAYITDLQSEIKILADEMETLKVDIENLENKYTSNRTMLMSFSAQIETISSVSAVDTVTSTNPIASVGSSTGTQAKFERKSLEEYQKQLSSKFDELWEKYDGNTDDIIKYVNDNISDFTDIDGDGNVTKIDLAILKNSKLEAIGYTKEQKTKNSYVQAISKAITSGSKSHKLDLDELEDYYRLGGSLSSWYTSRSKIFEPSNEIDFTKIAQSEDWEERLKNLSEQYGVLKYESLGGSLRNVTNYIKKLENYIKTNPQNVQYATLAIKYQEIKNYNSEIQQKAKETDWTAIAAEKIDIYDEELKNKSYYRSLYNSTRESWNRYNQNLKSPHSMGSFQSFLEKEAYERATGLTVGSDIGGCYCAAILSSVLKEKYLEDNLIEISLPNIDITGDGKIDEKDYIAFSTDIDLDGDGTVSDEEKAVLSNKKASMASSISKQIIEAGYNNKNSIDDVISYLSLDKNAELQESLNRQKEGNEKRARSFLGVTFDESDYKEGKDPYKNTIFYGSRAFTWGSYHDSFRDYVLSRYTTDELHKIMTIEKYDELYQEFFEYSYPPNTYLNYVKSANLSKEELQEILDKINSASPNIREQLAEVKKVVETKLANMQ